MAVANPKKSKSNNSSGMFEIDDDNFFRLYQHQSSEANFGKYNKQFGANIGSGSNPQIVTSNKSPSLNSRNSQTNITRKSKQGSEIETSTDPYYDNIIKPTNIHDRLFKDSKIRNKKKELMKDKNNEFNIDREKSSRLKKSNNKTRNQSYGRNKVLTYDSEADGYTEGRLDNEIEYYDIPSKGLHYDGIMIGHRLYYEGLKNKEAKEKDKLEKKIEKEKKEEDELTFAPNINPVTRMLTNTDARNSRRIEDY